jgi:hypothetical protein
MHAQQINNEKHNKYGDSVFVAKLEQNQKRTRDSSQFIFEGNLQYINTYNTSDKNGNNFIIESRTINVTKVFRGQLKLGTVELIRNIYPNGKTIYSPHKKSQKDTAFIFFCSEVKKNPFNASHNRGVFDNKMLLEYYGYGAISLKYKTGFDGGNSFPSLSSIYRYIGTFPNIKKPVVTQNDTIETRFIKILKKNQSRPQTISPSVRDSLNVLRQAKFIHESDSIYQINNRRYQYEDSIENVKKTLNLRN